MKKLLIITNLYPSNWDPNRATFNKQQFDHLTKHLDVSILVPVSWLDWLKLGREKRKQEALNDKVRYCWNFYTPKIMRRCYSFFMVFSFFLNSFFWIRRVKPEVLLASWAYPEGVAVGIIAKFLKVPFFIKVHGSDINEFAQDKARAKQIVWACNRAQGVFSVSKALKNQLVALGVDANKVHVIYNGIDKQKFFPSETEAKSNELLYIGNLKREKGIGELIKAFIKLKLSQSELTLTVAGSGAMQSEVCNLLEQAKLTDSVKFLGSVPHSQIPDLIRHAKILVLPSYAEGVPNVILESMSCGTPVVATSVGGVPEVVNEDTGVLVAPKNVEALVIGLQHALSKKWSSEKIVKQAEYFSWTSNAEQVHSHLVQDSDI